MESYVLGADFRAIKPITAIIKEVPITKICSILVRPRGNFKAGKSNLTEYRRAMPYIKKRVMNQESIRPNGVSRENKLKISVMATMSVPKIKLLKIKLCRHSEPDLKKEDEITAKIR